MNDMENLAVATALQKQLKENLDQRNSNSLRARCDQALLEMYEESGVDRRQLKINGQKVGTQSLTFAKSVDKVEAYVENYPKFIAWLQTEEGTSTLAHAVNIKPSLFTEQLEKTGEIADGVKMRQVNEPAHIKGTTVRVDVEAVKEAFGKELPNAIAGLLGGESGQTE